METINKKKSNLIVILCGIIAILAVLLFLKGCGSEPTIVKTPTPEVKGSFELAKPIHDTIIVTKKGKTKIVQSKEDEFLQSEIDRLLKEYNSLDAAFARANDSLQQEIYKRTIVPKLFSKFFDNDTLSATVKGIVANGEVDKLKLEYIIKSRNVDIKVPEVKFRLLGGLEAGMTKDLSNFNAKVNLGFQNKKGSIISIGADTEQRFYFGYQISIFSIKR